MPDYTDYKIFWDCADEQTAKDRYLQYTKKSRKIYQLPRQGHSHAGFSK